MVKRKYIKNILLFIFAICFFSILSFNSYADAWLPDVGSYQYLSTVSTVDKRSKNSKNRRSETFAKIRTEIDKLYDLRQSIEDKILVEQREPRNSEIRAFETIKKEIADLDEASNMLSSFRDEHFAQFSVEYGATDIQSFGAKFIYIIDKFAGYNNLDHNRKFIGKDADIFYKYQLFKNEKWAISLKPTVQFSSYDNKNSCKYIDLALFTGYSKQKKNGTNLFHEFGLGVRKYFRNSIGHKMGYSVSIMDGMKFKNGIMLTNFTQYERSKLKNLVYSHTLYEQISIAREFHLIKRSFTTQIGYFWKSSMIDKAFLVSGPILSIWLSV